MSALTEYLSQVKERAKAEKERAEYFDSADALDKLVDQDIPRLLAVIEEMQAALEQMHTALQNRQYENHHTLTSMPSQNGCLVYSEWKLRAIKEKALAKCEEIVQEAKDS